MKRFHIGQLAAGLSIACAGILVSLLAACVPPARPTPAAAATAVPTALPTATSAPQINRYVGRVIDDKTLAPIGGAKVALDFQGAPPIAHTDSEGVFRFSVPFSSPTLDVRVRVEADGYVIYERYITLMADEPEVEDIRLTARQPETAGGTVAPTAAPLRLTVQIWDVAMDQKNEIVASREFTATNAEQGAEALRQEAGRWIVQELGLDSPREAIKVQVHVPADLASEDIQITSPNPDDLEVYYYLVTGDGKSRLPLFLGGKELANLNEDFYLEVGWPGYNPIPILVRWGEQVDRELEFAPAPVGIAVEEFRNDSGTGPLWLTNYLSQYARVLDPAALDDLRKQIAASEAALAESPMAQVAIRKTLGVEYLIDGAYSK